MQHTERPLTDLMAVSNALVGLHKQQFGRGPIKARSTGSDTLVCTLEDVLLPAERKLVELGEAARVRDTRSSYQAATETEFVAAIEQIVYRKVRAFASAFDVNANVAYEVFTFERGEADASSIGAADDVYAAPG
jgi:uncharacterized protein YbcI